MVWSENTEQHNGVEQAESQIQAAKSHLPPEVIEDCEIIADCCHDQLEHCANEEHPHPHPCSQPTIQARNLVRTVKESPCYDAYDLHAFRRSNYEFGLNDTEKKLAESIVGLRILKNGSKKPPDEISISERLEGVVESISATD